MKKMIMLLTLFVMMSHEALADIDHPYNDVSDDIWIFYEPKEWDLTYEEAVKAITTMSSDSDFRVDGLFRYVIHRIDGEVERGWYITYRYKGSPYCVWRYFVPSPEGNAVLEYYPDFDYISFLDNSITDIEAIDLVFRKMIETDYIPKCADGSKLLTYTIDENMDPAVYIYHWIFSRGRIVPVSAVFSDGNSSIQKQFYISIGISPSQETYALFLYSADQILFWYMDTPFFDIDGFLSSTWVAWQKDD